MCHWLNIAHASRGKSHRSHTAVTGRHVTTVHARKPSAVLVLTGNTETVHTSAKSRLTGVAIRIRIPVMICDPDRPRNLIICSLAYCQPSLKISCKSVQKFLHKVANRQTDKQTNSDDYMCSMAEEIINLVQV